MRPPWFEPLPRRAAQTSKTSGFDPQAWLTDVLSRMAAHPGEGVHRLGVDSLVELIKIRKESTPTRQG